MRRPIKFRLWHEGQMWDWETLKYASPKVWAEADNVMQFTGFLDKNGGDIYEGDLILIDEEWARMTGSPGHPSRTLCLVGFKDGAFMYGRNPEAPGDHMDSNLRGTAPHYCAVVGNVYQTPAWDAPRAEQGQPS